MNESVKEMKLLNIKQVSEMLILSQSTIRRLAKTGQLKAYRVANRKLAFKPKDVQSLVKPLQ